MHICICILFVRCWRNSSRSCSFRVNTATYHQLREITALWSGTLVEWRKKRNAKLWKTNMRSIKVGFVVMFCNVWTVGMEIDVKFRSRIKLNLIRIKKFHQFHKCDLHGIKPNLKPIKALSIHRQLTWTSIHIEQYQLTVTHTTCNSQECSINFIEVHSHLTWL